MEEVLAWLIPSAAKRPQACTFCFGVCVCVWGAAAAVNAGHGIEKGSCHQYRYRRLLESCQVVNYVNVCSIYKMQLNIFCQRIRRLMMFAGAKQRSYGFRKVFYTHLYGAHIWQTDFAFKMSNCGYFACSDRCVISAHAERTNAVVPFMYLYGVSTSLVCS